MANDFSASDLKKGLVTRTVTYLLDWATAATTVTVLEGGEHPKMRLDKAILQNVNAALNATEPIINIRHGILTHEVVETVDMATAMGATAAVGFTVELDINEDYRYLAEDEAIAVQVETADGGSATRGLLTLSYTACKE